jgi:hypothetical protein
MEFLSRDDQFVADLPADDQEDHLFALDIIEHAEGARAKVELGHGVGSEPLDRLGGRRRLIAEPGKDRGLQGPPLVYGQGSQLLFGLVSDRDSEGHRWTLDRRVRDRHLASQHPRPDASALLVSAA